MCNHYKSERIVGRGYKQFTKSLPFLFLFLSLIFSSCQPVTNDVGGGTGANQSGGKPFFTLTVRASNKRSAGDSLRATVTYEPEVTWKSEQGFRSAVTDFVITVGNEAPQTVQLGSSVSSRGTYPEGSDVTVRYEAYGNVTFKNERGKTETKREVIASESKTVKVASSGTTVNFKVSEGIKTPDSYTEVVEDGKVKYVAGIAILGNVTGLPDEKEYAPGATVTPPTTVTWDYGNFDGWKADVDLEVTTPNGTSMVQAGDAIAIGSTFSMPESGVLLAAQWRETEYTINYDSTILSGGAQGNAQVDTKGAITFTMASDGTDDALSTYTDSTGNWAFGGWSTKPGTTSADISRIADIRTAVVAGTLKIASSNNSVTLYAVWADANTPFDVTVDASALELSGTTIPNVMNGADITLQVTNYLSQQSTGNVKYELKQGTTFTADVTQKTVTLSNDDVTTKVELHLANRIMTASGTQLFNSEVTFNDPGTSDDGGLTTWYEVGTALPTATVSGSDAQEYEIGNGWRSDDDATVLTTVTKDIAGKTLYPIGDQKVLVDITSANYTISHEDDATFYVSKNTDITNQVKNFIPANTSSQRFTWKTSATVNSGSNTTLEVDIDQYLDVENAFSVNITLDSASIGNVQNKFNGDDITSDVRNLLTAKNEANNKRYTWNTGTINASSTNQTVEIKTYCTVTAVQLTLSNQAIAGTGSGTYSLGNGAYTDTGSNGWYDIGTSLPTVNKDYIYDSSGRAAPGVAFSGYWGEESSSDQYTSVTEDLAGKTLKAIVGQFSSLTFKHYYLANGSQWSELTDTSSISVDPKAPPTSFTGTCKIKGEYNDSMNNVVITLTTESGSAETYTLLYNTNKICVGCFVELA